MLSKWEQWRIDTIAAAQKAREEGRHSEAIALAAMVRDTIHKK